MDDNFLIRRIGKSDPASLVLASVQSRGIALGYGADGDTAIVAGVNNFLGFLSRDVTTNGPTQSEIAIPTNLDVLPFKVGQEVGIITNIIELEVEGSTYIKEASTGALSASSPVGTKCSFLAGQFYEAQTGDTVRFTVAAQLTPLNGGAERLLLVKV